LVNFINENKEILWISLFSAWIKILLSPHRSLLKWAITTIKAIAWLRNWNELLSEDYN